MTLFLDQNGNLSSKRVFGGTLVVLGAGMYTALGVVSFFAIVANPAVISTAATWLVGFGAGLLGISVVEFLGKKKEE